MENILIELGYMEKFNEDILKKPPIMVKRKKEKEKRKRSYTINKWKKIDH